ncbi:hypothetical protein M0805_009375 [Coniferiporia weirii]|nr:hypothetical protein M0805_009375 [Coniferiporia weirii]
MTEYDYSPGAYARYQAKLRSVENWVNKQSYEAPGYQNPLMPEEPYVQPTKPLLRSLSSPADPRTAGSRPSRPDSHRPRDYREHNDPHYRGHSSNSSSQTLVQSYGSSAPKYAAAGSSQPQPQPQLQSRSHSHSRTSSRAHSRPPATRSRTYAYASQADYGATQGQVHPTRSATVPAQYPAQYASAPGQPLIMQHGRQTYVVVPPHGARVEVRSPQHVSPRYETAAAPVYSQPISPTSSSKKQPLLKRLFSGSNSSSRRVDVPVMSGGSRRRTNSLHC